MTALIFDIDDTMYERHTPFLQACRQVFGEEFGLDSRKLFRQFIKRGDEVFEASMNGTISVEEMRTLRIRRAMADFQTEITSSQALAFQDAYEWHQHHIHLSPQMERLFDWCGAQEYLLGIITNGTTEHQKMKYDALGLSRWFPVENLLITGDLGVSKPDPAVFTAAQKSLSLDPQTTWYIGDSYEHDVEAAHTAGWRTVWLDRENNQKYLPECVADHTVHTEEELFACIQGIKN